jgi:capsular exopolysaccharide synthesis family protein
MNESENIESGRHHHRSAKTQFASRLARYRDLLARKWWVLAVGAAVGILVEAAILHFQSPSFVSVGQMIVNVKLSIPQGTVITEELNNFLGTQATLMQSDIVMNRAFSRILPLETNVVPIAPSLKVSVSPRTSIFLLQATGHDPRFTQEFLQAAMEEYSKLKREMRKQASDTTVADLTEEVLGLEKDLRRAEEEIAQFQGTNSMVWLEEQGNTVGTYLAGLNQRHEGLRSEYDLLQTLTLDQNVQRMQDIGGTVPVAADPPPNAATATNSLVNNDSLAQDYLKAKQQLLLMKAEQQDLAQYLRPKHPKMVAMSEEIARRERLLEIYRQQNVEQLEGRKAAVALQIQNLEKDIREWNGRIVEISRKAAEYQKLKGNTQRLQNLYQQLLATVQTLDANKEIGAETVAIMQPATLAMLDNRKSKSNLLMAALCCVAASIGLLLLLDRLDDRVNSYAELESLFEEPVLVQIPREQSGSQRPLIAPDDSRHAMVEAYRNLRSSLLYISDSGKPPKTLLVTSSVPNEGKSMTVANLGITLASSGSRVLLIDGDLRKGVLHNRFGIPALTGLHEVLAESQDWQTLVSSTRYPNLFLLPRGAISHQSSELFIRAAAKEFFEEAATLYDFVIVDSAPVMAADDVTSLAPHMDAVLLVMRAEHTSARVARAALDLLYQRQVRILGIVFNAVRPGSADYYCYKYKDYYASYPEAASERRV